MVGTVYFCDAFSFSTCSHQPHSLFAVLKAMGSAEQKPKPGVEHLFTDVYAGEQPWNLVEQEKQLAEHAAKYPDHYVHAEH